MPSATSALCRGSAVRPSDGWNELRSNSLRAQAITAHMAGSLTGLPGSVSTSGARASARNPPNACSVSRADAGASVSGGTADSESCGGDASGAASEGVASGEVSTSAIMPGTTSPETASDPARPCGADTVVTSAIRCPATRTACRYPRAAVGDDPADRAHSVLEFAFEEAGFRMAGAGRMGAACSTCWPPSVPCAWPEVSAPPELRTTTPGAGSL